MKIFLKFFGLICSLLGLIGFLIILPAWQFEILGDWRVIFLSVSYFIFFLGTVGRVVQYGKLANRKDDRQVQATSGRLASLITIAGLISFHWLSLYSFSLSNIEFDPVIDRYLISIGISLVCVGIIVSQVAINTLGKFFDRLTIKTDHQLVTEGIYSLVRHPIYTSYIFLFLGFCIVLHSLSGLGLLLATCFTWFGNRIGIEEQMLEEKFGKEYQSYCDQTKRLFPYLY